MAPRAPYRKGEEVREDILQAAQDLLATRSPSEVSLRDIARQGGFQHSLITRHFGTKDALVDEVVRRTLDSYARAVGDADDPVDGFRRAIDHVAAHPESFRAMARALIDPRRRGADGDPTAGFRAHRERLRDREVVDDRIDPDVLVVALMAFTSGWAFMEDRWLRTAGLGDADRSCVRDQITELIRRLIDAT